MAGGGDRAGQSGSSGSPRRFVRVPAPAVVTGGIALVAGLAWGAQAAYEASRQAPFAGLIVPVAIFLSLILAAVLAVIGAVARSVGHRTLGTACLAPAAAVVVATVVGMVVGPALGYRYREPVYVDRGALANLALQDTEAFVARLDAKGTCTTFDSSQAIGSISVANLGSLREARLMAGLRLGLGAASGHITFDVGGEAFTDGRLTPVWEGAVTLSAAVDGSAGTATFDLPMSGPGTDSTPGGWPSRLIGALRWLCGGPGETEATPEAQTTGRLEVELAGVPWEAMAGDDVVCEGSAVSGTVGSLQGQAFRAEVGVTGDRIGDPVSVWIRMDVGKELPPGLTYAPSWQGSASIVEIGEDGRSGRATFTDLPTGVDPEAGPAPTGWPTTIRGSLSWDCPT